LTQTAKTLTIHLGTSRQFYLTYRNISGTSNPFEDDSSEKGTKSLSSDSKGIYSFEKDLLGDSLEVPQEFKAIFGIEKGRFYLNP
jgi:hypothetical protein